MIKQDDNEAAASSDEPVAWQWRYIGNSVWNTQSGGAMLTAEQLVGERPIEQRPLYASPTTSPEPDAVREALKAARQALVVAVGAHPDLQHTSTIQQGFHVIDAALSAPVAKD